MKIIGRTNAGRVRSNNEDAFGADTELGVAVLADGMGGLNAGEVASREAVDRVLETLRRVDELNADALGQAMRAANRHVYDLSRRNPNLRNMGTTLVVWMAVPGQCLVGHVGDSRAYRITDSGLELLTHDHSVVQGLVDQGVISTEEARRAPNRNVITRAVGLESTVDCEIVAHPRTDGELFLLCSDGLTDMLDGEVLSTLCQGASADRLEPLADLLVAAANSAGGLDNVTVMLIGG